MAAPVAAAAARIAGALAKRRLKQKAADSGGGETVLLALLGALLFALIAILMLMMLPLVLIGGIFGSEDGTLQQPCGDIVGLPCEYGGDLPTLALPFRDMYFDAGKVFHVNPYALMALHETESTYSMSTLPGVRSGANEAGAMGPMQFIAGTWVTHMDASKQATIPRPDSYPGKVPAPVRLPSVYDSFDAIYAAAHYLEQLGAKEQLDTFTLQAFRHYKGTPPYSEPYARRAYEIAQKYQAQAQSGFDGPLPTGPTGVITGIDGLARPPLGAPPQVEGIFEAANEIRFKPYLLVHYPTHLRNPTYDCSSSTSHALWGGRLFGVAPWVSSQFEDYGEAGVGRWVTVWYRPGEGGRGHVFLVVAGLRFDTARYYGDKALPLGDGPRWTANLQPLKTIAQEGFRPRHPEGL